MSMAQGGLPIWKEVTLAEDHTASNVGNQSYWYSFLGIGDDPDVSQNVYLCVFTNNDLTNQYKIGFVAYASNLVVMFRNDYTQSANTTLTGTSYSMYAKAGTKITVYKYPM